MVFFKAVCYANPEAERSFPGSSPYILRHIFWKFPICHFGHINQDIPLNL